MLARSLGYECSTLGEKTLAFTFLHDKGRLLEVARVLSQQGNESIVCLARDLQSLPQRLAVYLSRQALSEEEAN